MIDSGVLERRIEFEAYVDVSFAEHSQIKTRWSYEQATTGAPSDG